MLFVDTRIGSKHLIPSLTRAALPVSGVTLPFGDVAFVGRGPGGTSLNIGLELKTLPDLVNSLRTDRLSGHQLPGLLEAYDHCWLVVEGTYTCSRAGQVTLRKGQWSVPVHGHMPLSELDKRLLTLDLQAGLHIWHTISRSDTVRFVTTLYRWWTDVNQDQHRSHIAVHQPASLVPLSDFRRVVTQFPRIGIRTSLAVERHFGGDLIRAANAPVAEWAAVQTGSKRLGTSSAEAIVRFLRGQ